MRAILLILTMAGCSTIPLAELGQSIEETASSVVYAVTESAVPVSRSARPVSRPQSVLHTIRTVSVSAENPLSVAEQYLGYNENTHRAELRNFIGVDPRQTEWCAAFVNSVLHTLGQPGSETVSAHPLLARSFIDWGKPVDHKNQEPEPGDVVVFPRGRQSWQGHVGFYVDTVTVDGKEYWQILGGNQRNSVTIELYDPARAISVRRTPAPEREARNLLTIIRSWFA